MIRYWFSSARKTWLINDKYQYAWFAGDKLLEVTQVNTILIGPSRFLANSDHIHSLIQTIFQAKSIEAQ